MIRRTERFCGCLFSFFFMWTTRFASRRGVAVLAEQATLWNQPVAFLRSSPGVQVLTNKRPRGEARLRSILPTPSVFYDSSTFRLRAQASKNIDDAGFDGNSDKPEVEPTWTYTPYDPKTNSLNPNLPRRRLFSTWTVPKTINIPEDRLEITFARSSGAGGQNVNKVNTKVELRFLVDEADWIPEEVRDRLKEQQGNRINKDGFMNIQSQEYRTQGQNRKAAVAKLEEMLREAWPRPKIRKQRKGPSKAAKERNKEFKKKRSEVKARRRAVDF